MGRNGNNSELMKIRYKSKLQVLCPTFVIQNDNF